MSVRGKLRELLKAALEECRAAGELVADSFPPLVIETPADPLHGDFATNVAMQLARAERKAPRAVAAVIVEQLAKSPAIFARIEIAGPGFINLYLQPSFWQQQLPAVLAEGFSFGCSAAGAGRKVQVEFVSANPTGPLHIGHGRGAAIGDTICRLLQPTGWDVTREFYYNDAGQQITNLALSVQARCLGREPDDPPWPADGYQGEYITDLAKAYLAGESVAAEGSV